MLWLLRRPAGPPPLREQPGGRAGAPSRSPLLHPLPPSETKPSVKPCRMRTGAFPEDLETSRRERDANAELGKVAGPARNTAVQGEPSRGQSCLPSTHRRTMRPPVPPAEEVGARSTAGHPQRPDPQTRVTFLSSGWQGLWFKTVLTSVPRRTRMRSSELPT